MGGRDPCLGARRAEFILTMTPRTSDITAAKTLAQSATVNDAIQSIIAELVEAQSGLVGARPATAELMQSYEDALAQYGELRGRAALYPYIGSGIGNGPLVELADGSVKWDMINGIGVHMFGHSDPDLIETALRAALSDVVMHGNLQFNADVIDFADLIVTEASRSSDLKYCFLTNSGTMANESALKVCAQKHEAAPRVLAFADNFMGRSTTMSQIGDCAANRVGLPLNTLVDYLPFYDPEHGERSIDDALHQLQRYIDRYPHQHACFVMELVQGEGGFNLAPREFFAALMQRCKDNGIAVWIDEIQTFGRTNEMFHFDALTLGEYVDVVTIGKMSQICACLYTEAYNPKPGLLSGTFVGSAVGLQVGRRSLQRLREGGYYGPNGKIAKLHRAFCEHTETLVTRHPEWFTPVPHASGAGGVASGFYGGVGGMMRFTPFGGDKAKITNALRIMFDEGVIAFYCGHGPHHIRFLPPIGVMEPAHFDDVFRIVESSLSKAASSNP